jgi:hypothetical protein
VSLRLRKNHSVYIIKIVLHSKNGRPKEREGDIQCLTPSSGNAASFVFELRDLASDSLDDLIILQLNRISLERRYLRLASKMLSKK